jgi:Holliday junction resolvase RusA-like endonuclease
MVKGGVDSQIQKMIVEKHYDKINPRIEIEIN